MIPRALRHRMTVVVEENIGTGDSDDAEKALVSVEIYGGCGLPS